MTQHIKDSFSQIFSFTRVYWSDCRCGTKNWCPWSKHMTSQRVTLYQALVRSLGSPKTALNLLHVWGRKVVVSFTTTLALSSVCHTKLNHVIVCLWSWPSLHTTHHCLLNWHICCLEVDLNLHSSWLRCSLHQRSYHSLLTSIKFPLLASEARFLIILHVVETGTWRSLGIHV